MELDKRKLSSNLLEFWKEYQEVFLPYQYLLGKHIAFPHLQQQWNDVLTQVVLSLMNEEHRLVPINLTT